MKKKTLLIIGILLTLKLGINAQSIITIKNAPLCGQPECAEEAKLKDSLDLALVSVANLIDKSQLISISDNVDKAANKYKIADEPTGFADTNTENAPQNEPEIVNSEKGVVVSDVENEKETHRIKSKAYHIEPLNAMIFVPEKFTPNGDQINDKFYVYGADIKGFTLKIYDGQKRLVFNATSMDKGWNGKVQGKYVYGTYNYAITFPIGNGQIETLRGTIEAIDN